MPEFTSIAPQTPGASIDPASSSVAELRQAMADGRLTATALTQHFLARIEELNPSLHAVITVNHDAIAEAAASDEAWESGRPRGPLEGIPVLVKDNVQVAGMPTTAGSPALLPACPPDAFIVARLRAAGAVILAKANLSEWANFRSTHSSSGWSSLGGQASNPYVLDRSPSGSSSGSAAGVSAGLAPLAVGTETDGSIVSPSSACGVVGVKPTAGLVSRTGIVPLSPVQDTAGPMAKSVADAAAMLSVLAAADPDDPAASGLAGSRCHRLHPVSRPGRARRRADRRLAGRLRPGGRRHEGAARRGGADVAVARRGGDRSCGPAGRGQDHDPGVRRAVLRVQVRHQRLPQVPGHRGQLADIPGSLAGLIEFNERNAAWVLCRFGQEIFYAAEATTGNLADPDYLELRGVATRLAVASLETPTTEHRLDAIISLTANPAWLTDYVLGDHSVFGASRPAAVSGWPAISVPFGYVRGLPVGVTLVGPRWSEPRLLAIAYAFEQATAARRQPSLLPTLPPPLPGTEDLALPQPGE